MSVRRPNMTPHKTPMAEQPVETRIKNLSEVGLGYTTEQAMAEAERCMNCPERYCAENCPAHTAIPVFIEKIRAGDFEKAYEIIASTNPCAAISSRLCPYERQCESACTRGIKHEPVAIGRLERFVCDKHRLKGAEILYPASKKTGSAAIVGSGPAGLCCARVLVRAGVSVTVFEKSNRVGGALSWGIPAFVVPKVLLGDLVGELVTYGVTFKTGMELGRDMTLSDLHSKFDAVFLASGAGKPSGFPPMDGQPGVMQAADYLAAPLKPSAARVAVFGDGGTAIDTARAVLRAGADEVSLVIWRTEKEIPTTQAELELARTEGVKVITLLSPAGFITESGKLTGVECHIMTFTAPDYPGGFGNVVPSGRRVVIDADLAIIAFGFVNKPVEGVETDSRNRIIVDEQYMTSKSRIFAGGEAVTGPSTFMKSAATGMAAAEAMLQACFADRARDIE
jgi:glutamate synthase (NADPH/NADH) small chain